MTGRSRDRGENSGNLSVTERNERLVREYFQAVWNEGNVDVFDTDVGSDDYVLHVQSNDQYSVEELRRAWSDWPHAFSDLSNDVQDLIVTGDRVVIRQRFSGTHEAEILGIPATGKTVETTGDAIFRLGNGQIADAWTIDDVVEIRQQLGEIS